VYSRFDLILWSVDLVEYKTTFFLLLIVKNPAANSEKVCILIWWVCHVGYVNIKRFDWLHL